MSEAKIIEVFGLYISVPVMISTIVTCVLIGAFCVMASRKVALVPGRFQNVLEYIVDFSKGIIESNMEWSIGQAYHLFIFTLFLFIFVANTVGLIVFVHLGEVSYFSSPTANPVVTLVLAAVVLVISNYSGVQKMGFKGYVQSAFFSPSPIMFPLKVVEEFSSMITLALRLYGNIYAGEVLLELIVQLAESNGLPTAVLALPIGIIWQGFSVAIGLLQAYIFCTLSMVYISHKLEHE